MVTIDLKGLSQDEVDERIKQGKINTTTKESTRTYQGIIFSNLFSLLNITIFVIAAILVNLYFVFHEIRTVFDAISISSVAVVNSIVGIIQEIRAKLALEKIIALSDSTATVLRDGKLLDIPQEAIVVDDIIKVVRGDQIPIDGTVLESQACEVDESLLTGESDYLLKEAEQNVLSGSFCVAGFAYIKTNKVGANSYINKLTHEVKDYKRFFSPLQQKINLLVKIGVSVALVIFIVLVTDTIIDKLYLQQEPNWIELVRHIASLVTSLIPIGLILLSSVAFALGIVRISKKGALVQKLNAIESFAHVTTICMDKTGTLTQNKLSLQSINPIGKHSLEELRCLVGTWAHKASDQNPTSIAIKKVCGCYEGDIIDEIPFNSKNKYSALSVNSNEIGKIHLFIGAYEKLKPYFSEADCKKITTQLEQQRQYRNLILAELPKVKKSLKDDLKDKIHLEALAVVSLVDDIRPNIEEVLKHFHQRNIHLKIVSGDAPETVQSVAERSGWKENLDTVITGTKLDKMTPKEFDHAAKNNSLFARVSPQNKKDIITSLQKQKEYVSMIGDGVNDVLALKQAELGIAMNAGNRMSKDVSDIILLDNDFTVMPEVFKEGQTIIGNISSSAKLFLTKNMFAALLISICAFAGLAFPLIPRHVSLMGVFAITLPALLITFSKRITFNSKNFLREILEFTLITGAVVALCGTLVLWFSQSYLSSNLETARTAMLSQIIVLTLLNFLLVLEPKNLSKLIHDSPKLLVFALSFIGVYFICLQAITNLSFLKKLQIFLELSPLNYGHYIMLILISFFGGLGMVLLHRWRALRS